MDEAVDASDVWDVAAGSVVKGRKGGTLDKLDAIIGATAVHHGLVLVTYNTKHFPMAELKVSQDLPEAR
jgi:predicted nucleic acid-binding protein